MKPYIYGPKFMWNLDASVGKGGSNSDPCDVSFIQWYYILAADFHLTDLDRKVLYRKVQLTGTCAGTDADPLVQAILAHQRILNHPQIDGRISVVHGTAKIGASAFFLLRLEARFAVMYPDKWPRLDLIPRCPPKVAEVSRYAIPAMSELTQ
ncbi:hypothetical protein SAZ10_24930 [Mesorhizobium sp. BAC0120]|uniref:hypothetical protein n=1 Tax=Mesorhizobium sp. BAC0120 TaxID=3090670 RepID=UPI00298BD854|nr:hypothetical protein [Mesorhizobium sp. BAC0120]MDW6025006.1 hypothetical protein [Mesorhizobium sp. BAC0120]